MPTLRGVIGKLKEEEGFNSQNFERKVETKTEISKEVGGSIIKAKKNL